MYPYQIWSCLSPASAPPTLPFSHCLGCPGILSVPRTSQQGSWAGLLRRLCLQAPRVRGFLWFRVTSPVRPSRALRGNCQPPFSLTPWLIRPVLYSTYHHLQSSYSFVHVLIFHLFPKEYVCGEQKFYLSCLLLCHQNLQVHPAIPRSQ